LFADISADWGYYADGGVKKFDWIPQEVGQIGQSGVPSLLSSWGRPCSPDGRRIIVTTYLHELFADPDDEKKWNTLPTRVFDVATGKEIHRFYGNPEKKRSAARYSCSACSPDGRLLAVAEGESTLIRLIEIESGEVRAQFKGHRDGVNDLAFSPDGKTLASGGNDNVIYLWDLTISGAR